MAGLRLGQKRAHHHAAATRLLYSRLDGVRQFRTRVGRVVVFERPLEARDGECWLQGFLGQDVWHGPGHNDDRGHKNVQAMHGVPHTLSIETGAEAVMKRL